MSLKAYRFGQRLSGNGKQDGSASRIITGISWRDGNIPKPAAENNENAQVQSPVGEKDGFNFNRPRPGQKTEGLIYEGKTYGMRFDSIHDNRSHNWFHCVALHHKCMACLCRQGRKNCLVAGISDWVRSLYRTSWNPRGRHHVDLNDVSKIG